MRSIFILAPIFIASTWAKQKILSNDYEDIALPKDQSIKVEFQRDPTKCNQWQPICLCYKGVMKYSSMDGWFPSTICGHDAVYFCFGNETDKLIMYHTLYDRDYWRGGDDRVPIPDISPTQFTFEFNRLGLIKIPTFQTLSPPEYFPIKGDNHDAKYDGIVKMAARGCDFGRVTIIGDYLDTLQTPPRSQLYLRPSEIEPSGKTYFMPGADIFYVAAKGLHKLQTHEQIYACLCYESEQPGHVILEAKCPFENSSQICFYNRPAINMNEPDFDYFISGNLQENEIKIKWDVMAVEAEYYPDDPFETKIVYNYHAPMRISQPKFRYGYRLGSSKKERTIKLAAVTSKSQYSFFVSGLREGVVFDEPNQQLDGTG